ncbi:MAG: bifunctional hydroxymethylpyrimidine kinase/phosphomethylpyrimidine kinase [Pseudomarimonas sp.]
MQHTSEHPHRRSVLSIAGSDSGGGAGIQADLRTICAHGLHPLTAITALTAQNTRGVSAIHPCPIDVLEAQIASAFADFDIAAVKIGMLANVSVIDCVASALQQRPQIAVVLDPVMVATSGAALLEADAVACLIQRLFPLATVITPNLPEALLLGAPGVVTAADLAPAAAQLRRLGAKAVLLKGGHLNGPEAIDWLDSDSHTQQFSHPRLAVEGHGTGCTLASAIACGLALGLPLDQACRAAADYVHGALRHAYRPGQSMLAVLAHDWCQWSPSHTAST